mmetsp:Transcript_16351/g.24211  ORF Transcript_16351/g.24211 Transcript_16351/m.24211 type:complete len:174 (-) Transcript_16351:818-1339(-)
MSDTDMMTTETIDSLQVAIPPERHAHVGEEWKELYPVEGFEEAADECVTEESALEESMQRENTPNRWRKQQESPERVYYITEWPTEVTTMDDLDHIRCLASYGMLLKRHSKYRRLQKLLLVGQSDQQSKGGRKHQYNSRFQHVHKRQGPRSLVKRRQGSSRRRAWCRKIIASL